jgi:protein disulfide-isomerase A1
MRKIFGLICLALLFLASAALPPLEANNYDQIINDHPLLMVKFFASDCTHCKQVAPEFAKLADSAATGGFSVSEVNCEEESAICSKNSVSAYPTFKLFVEGYPIEYTGGRKSEDFTEWIGWVKKQISGKLAALTPEQIEKKKGKEVFVVGWGLNEVEKKMVKIAGSMSENVKFYQAEQESSSPRIALVLKNHTELDFPKTFIIPGELSNWAFKKALPAVIPFNVQENVNYILSQKEIKFMLIFMDHQKGQSK